MTEKQWAVPTSIEFWDYIFGNASGWGLNTIKQDHIVRFSFLFSFFLAYYLYQNEQLLDMNATLADVTTARLWLLNEGIVFIFAINEKYLYLHKVGKGAYHHGINIEYCMDFTSVLLTSLENPTATHSRAGKFFLIAASLSSINLFLGGDYLPGGASTQWRIGVTR